MRRTCLRALEAVAVILATVGGSLIVGEGIAGASCAVAMTVTEALQQADIVVVGTVITTRSRGRIATVNVEDVWKGHVGSRLEVFGGPDSENTLTSVDRTYTIGTRYLLFVHEPSAHGYQPTFGGRYEDNICSDTRPYIQELAALRPRTATRVEHPARPHPSARVAAPISHSKDAHRAWWLVVGAAAVAIVATFVVRHTRRDRRSAIGPPPLWRER